MVLATVVHTAGPTYTKAGTLMVIAASGEYAGLLSGGCLEGDLAEHGRAVCIGESLPEAGGTWADLVDQAKHLPRTASSCFMSRALPGTDLLGLIQPAPTQLTGRDLDRQPDFESFRHGMQARTDSGQLAPLAQRGPRRFGELPRVSGEPDDTDRSRDDGFGWRHTRPECKPRSLQTRGFHQASRNIDQ